MTTEEVLVCDKLRVRSVGLSIFIGDEHLGRGDEQDLSFVSGHTVCFVSGTCVLANGSTLRRYSAPKEGPQKRI